MQMTDKTDNGLSKEMGSQTMGASLKTAQRVGLDALGK